MICVMLILNFDCIDHCNTCVDFRPCLINSPLDPVQLCPRSFHHLIERKGTLKSKDLKIKNGNREITAIKFIRSTKLNQETSLQVGLSYHE